MVIVPFTDLQRQKSPLLRRLVPLLLWTSAYVLGVVMDVGSSLIGSSIRCILPAGLKK